MLRGINDRAALDLLLEHGPLSRTRLGELTGLSKPTASQLLSRLETAGLVVASGSSYGGPGPRAQLYAVNPRAGHVAAMDVTPARIVAAVADITGRTVGEHELRTPRRAGPDAVANVLTALTGAATAAGVDVSDLLHVAIGTPGAFDPRTRRLRYARHLPGWHEPDLLERLADALAVPLQVDNDVNLAGVAELEAGRARGVEDFLLVWVDDGLGAAIVIGGRLYGGVTGGAGEIGFLPLPAAAVRTAVDTPGAGDELVATLGHRLALGIAAVLAVLDPALVVLSGSVALAGGERLRAAIADELGSLAAARPRLELADVREGPVLAGALQTALTAARDDLFDTVRHLSNPGSARPVTRRAP
jgi:predicted NBD/HSP70 family sugar kinase